jgi:hypothetical protein
MQGVGTRKIKTQKFYFLEKCKPKRLSLGLLTMKEEEGRVGKIVPQLRRFLFDVLGPQMGCSSSFLVQICKKPSKQSLLEKLQKRPKSLENFLLEQTINFLCKNQQVIYI